MDDVTIQLPAYLSAEHKAELARRVPGVIRVAVAQHGLPLVPCPNIDHTLILDMTATAEKRELVAATLTGLPATWQNAHCAACGDAVLVPAQHLRWTGARVCWLCIAVLDAITDPPMMVAMVKPNE